MAGLPLWLLRCDHDGTLQQGRQRFTHVASLVAVSSKSQYSALFAHSKVQVYSTACRLVEREYNFKATSEFGRFHRPVGLESDSNRVETCWWASLGGVDHDSSLEECKGIYPPRRVPSTPSPTLRIYTASILTCPCLRTRVATKLGRGKASCSR
ncbi:hypothetical protein BC834DRAFT_510162 [Gloeopeniophorella convolvens]|nr:hypothetical protein BC834DRAFT_510162 [Gloeopeniophorella convolvens]